MTVEYLDFSNDIAVHEVDSFVSSHKSGSFMQCSAWSVLKSGWGRDFIIIRNDKDGKIQASALLLTKKIPYLKKTFVYCPRGPVCCHSDDSFMLIMEEIKLYAKKNKAVLCRFDPPWEESTELREIFNKMGMRHTDEKDDYASIQIRHNYVIDIKDMSEEEVFASFDSKYRYKIRKAERNGVVCRCESESALDDFCAIMEQTAKRDGFTARGKAYYSAMLKSLGDICRLYMCYVGEEAVSGAIAINFGGRVSYVYGASSDNNRNFFASHLMQWEMIKWAVSEGCELYDFMGIPFYYDENHPNYGVYRFKKGFNGRVVSYTGEYDMIISPLFGRLFRFYTSHLKAFTHILNR